MVLIKTKKMFFLEKVEIIIWKFKDLPEILKSTLYIYENTLNVWILGMRRIHSIHGPHAIVI